MYLEPVRRSRHDIDKMDTTTPFHFNDTIISTNAQGITYQETVSTRPSGCQPVNEPFRNIAEEFYRDISLLTLKEYSFRFTTQPSFLLRRISRHKNFVNNIRPTSENENKKGVTTIMH